MPASPFLYFADERLSRAELCAARLDGHVVEIDDAYMPADAVETPALRAGSLRDLLGDTLAASHLTAAWVHGALVEPPRRHTVQRAVPRRLHHVFGRRIRYRESPVEENDLVTLGGVRVTSPVRTLIDLARVPDDAHAAAARALADAVPGLARAAIDRVVVSARHPHKRTALAFLAGLAAREELVTTL